jgi:hypothetical protein
VTTFNARTYLQPQLNKAVALERREEACKLLLAPPPPPLLPPPGGGDAVSMPFSAEPVEWSDDQSHITHAYIYNIYPWWVMHVAAR